MKTRVFHKAGKRAISLAFALAVGITAIFATMPRTPARAAEGDTIPFLGALTEFKWTNASSFSSTPVSLSDMTIDELKGTLFTRGVGLSITPTVSPLIRLTLRLPLPMENNRNYDLHLPEVFLSGSGSLVMYYHRSTAIRERIFSYKASQFSGSPMLEETHTITTGDWNSHYLTLEFQFATSEASLFALGGPVLVDVGGVQSGGYDEGYQAGHDAGYTEGKQDGIASGMQAGYDSGYAEGKEDGRTEGYEDGKTDGHDEGYELGYSEGYDEGLRWALAPQFNEKYTPHSGTMSQFAYDAQKDLYSTVFSMRFCDMVGGSYYYHVIDDVKFLDDYWDDSWKINSSGDTERYTLESWAIGDTFKSLDLVYDPIDPLTMRMGYKWSSNPVSGVTEKKVFANSQDLFQWRLFSSTSLVGKKCFLFFTRTVGDKKLYIVLTAEIIKSEKQAAGLQVTGEKQIYDTAYAKGHADAYSQYSLLGTLFPEVLGSVSRFIGDTLGGMTIFGISALDVFLTFVMIALVSFVIRFVK